MSPIDLKKLTDALQEKLKDRNIKLTILDPKTMTQAEMAYAIRELKDEYEKNNFKNN